MFPLAQVISLIGFMGSGKTGIGIGLAHKLNLKFVDLDAEIVDRASLSINKIFSNYGEKYFRELESNTLKEILDQEKGIILSTGGGTPCFYDNMQLLKERTFSVYLQVSPDDLLERLKEKRTERPLLRDMSEIQLYDYIQSTLRKRSIYYSRAELCVRLDNREKSKNIDYLASLLTTQ